MICLRDCIRFALLVPLLSCICFGQSGSPAKNDTIIFESGPEGSDHNVLLNPNIYSMNADGTNVKALTRDAQNNYEASWSRDGRRIAFIHGRNPFEVSVMDRDGGNSRRLQLDPAAIRAALDNDPALAGLETPAITWMTWSPDGKVAATFVTNSYSKTVKPSPTFLFSPDTDSEPRFLFSGVSTPSWSRDGQSLVMTVNEGSMPQGEPLFAIYTANIDGSMRTRVTPQTMTATTPAWSPDGKQIAFVGSTPPSSRGYDQVFIMNRDGSAIRQVTNDPAWEACFHPTWSPDGQRIAFSCRAAKSCPAGVGGIAGPWSCIRRIFVIAPQNLPTKLTPVLDQDGINPTFAPVN